ncbi:Hypothetical predicted protein, partial [Podarcis lilfordi]
VWHFKYLVVICVAPPSEHGSLQNSSFREQGFASTHPNPTILNPQKLIAFPNPHMNLTFRRSIH